MQREQRPRPVQDAPFFRHAKDQSMDKRPRPSDLVLTRRDRALCDWPGCLQVGGGLVGPHRKLVDQRPPIGVTTPAPLADNGQPERLGGPDGVLGGRPAVPAMAAMASRCSEHMPCLTTSSPMTLSTASSDVVNFATMAGRIGVLPLLEDVSFTVNERERLRRDDLSRSDSTL
jgi:hypothetical protein